MDMQTSGARGAWEFEGNWREFLPIAATNLVLTIVTLGIYRFWAKARERRYLWSRTRFIDDHLEWTGTGTEMFLGFLMVMLVLIPFLLFFQFGLQALVLRGQGVLAGVLGFVTYLGFFWLIGFAVFRALRYRLTRTWWHGIRGGSDDPGVRYGFQALGKTILGSLLLGLLIPWSMTQLWNDRWNRMSFGPHRFEAHADTEGLMGRWLLLYLVPILTLLIGVATAGSIAGLAPEQAGAGLGLGVLLAPLAFYVLLGLASIAYYAKYYRQVVAATSVGPLNFAFTASTLDWFKLILGNIALVVFTLGLGLTFIAYRNWSFAVSHLRAAGEVDLSQFTQSSTSPARDAEGLASAFDIGAI